MALGERDPHSGHSLTGHEWNGITELNTRVPRPVWWFLGAAALFSAFYWILMPAWPTGASFTPGVLGHDQRASVDRAVADAARGRALWRARISAMDYAAIQEDGELMAFVRDAGSTLFGDNCAACHGPAGEGAKGYPNLTDDDWIWGGAPHEIHETIRVGVNADGHTESRVGIMQAFGRDGLIDRATALDLVAHVQALRDPTANAGRAPERLEAGAQAFAENCATCHGDDGRGDASLGAPNLADGIWLYGGDPQSILESIWAGREGVMTPWERRLSPMQRKILTLYVLDLGERGGG